MFIDRIKVKNFRNLVEQEISFCDEVNILTGVNAQGKTNVIEAIWLFSACKSFRTNNEKDFIQNDCDQTGIDLFFQKDNRKQIAQIRYYEKRRRELLLNNIKVKPSELIGNIVSVLFFPEHLNLVKEGPEIRRKFIDIAICQIKPVYFSLLVNYNKVLFQRNSVLKNQTKEMNKTLEIWDDKLITLGTSIYMIRKEYIKEINKYSSFVIDEMTGGKESLYIQYKTMYLDSNDKEKIQADMKQVLLRNRKNDFRLGYTTQGIHKDDLLFYLNDNPAKSFGSQGQPRSIVLALKLAEAEILKNIYDEYPVLLFDDVFSELDKNRKNYIVEKIKNKQVIITSCEKVKEFKNANIFEITAGKVNQL